MLAPVAIWLPGALQRPICSVPLAPTSALAWFRGSGNGRCEGRERRGRGCERMALLAPVAVWLPGALQRPICCVPLAPSSALAWLRGSGGGRCEGRERCGRGCERMALLAPVAVWLPGALQRPICCVPFAPSSALAWFRSNGSGRCEGRERRRRGLITAAAIFHDNSKI